MFVSHLCTQRSINAPVDSVDGQDCIAPYVAVTVLQTGTDRWHKGLQQLRFLQLAQEAQGGATDELIGMLEILQMQNTYGTFRQRNIHPHNKHYT